MRRRTLLKRLSLANRLSLLVTAAVVFSVGILGLYFDSFLRQEYLQSTKKRMLHAFERLATDIGHIEYELAEGISFIESDESTLASIELINNYQNKKHYNAILLDEEKKLLAEELLKRVKLSLNNDIALYDDLLELVVYVTKHDGKYRLNFIAYEDGESVLYTKMEREDVYRKTAYREHPLIPYRHRLDYQILETGARSLITHHLAGNRIIIKSHRSIYDEGSAKVSAHIEMSRTLDENFFASLSEDLDMSLFASTDAQYAAMSHPLTEQQAAEQLRTAESDASYYAAAVISTLGGPVYLVTTLDKTFLKSTLNNNRVKFLLWVLLVGAVLLGIFRYLFTKSLVLPLAKLMEQVEKIEKRDYTKSGLVRTGDELEVISKNINQLAVTVRERESALKESRKVLEHLSNHDALTGLPNRRLFLLRLDHALDLARRNGTRAAVFFLDLDQFKHVNDTMGHDVGDELLKAVSKRLSQSIRKSDTIARIGGDEFNLLVEDIEDVRDLEMVVQKLIVDFKTPFSCSGQEISTTASIGIAVFPNDGTDGVTLVKNADLAMYKSKEEGRNSYSFFSRELAEYLETRTVRINAMRHALEKGNEFRLLYQPKISVKTGKVVAIEALLRWHSDSLGEILPDRFIPLAEETHQIIPIGEWAMQNACRDFVRLKAEGYDFERISINVSSVQLSSSNVVKLLRNIVKMTGIMPENIELEITESFIATNNSAVLQSLWELRNMQVGLAVDDFGTGYSSMSYLQKLPLTRLKIDKTFVEDLPESEGSVALARAIIALAKTFHLSITAEGVENEKQLAFLMQEGCDDIQGYYYSEPLTIDELKKFYREFSDGHVH